MLIYGAFGLLSGFLITPSQNSIYPGFIIGKILESNGATALLALPFNADYVNDESKGKATGITITFSALGALLGNLILKILFNFDINLKNCYIISGVFFFTCIILYSFGIKSGFYFLENNNSKVK